MNCRAEVMGPGQRLMVYKGDSTAVENGSDTEVHVPLKAAVRYIAEEGLRRISNVSVSCA